MLDPTRANMDQKRKNEIEKIIGKINCPKDFRCYKCSNERNEDLCDAIDVGIDGFLLCIEEDPRDCVFSFPHDNIYFCKCPLREFLEKNRD